MMTQKQATSKLSTYMMYSCGFLDLTILEHAEDENEDARIFWPIIFNDYD